MSDEEERDEATIIGAAIDAADGIRAEAGSALKGQKLIVEILEDLRDHLDASRIQALMPDEYALDLAAYRASVEPQCPELRSWTHSKDGARSYPIRFVWRLPVKLAKGKVTLGTCKVFPKREAALWDIEAGPAPWWEVEISLPAWLLATESERLHLLHHELMHCDIRTDDKGAKKPATRGHDIQEFSATVGRFGPLTAADSVFAENLTRHPRNEQFREEKAKAWAEDPYGQGMLFAPFQAQIGGNAGPRPERMPDISVTFTSADAPILREAAQAMRKL